MNSPAETVVVSMIVLLAGVYLGRRYLRKRQAKASGCGGSCGCAATKAPLKR